MTKQIAFTVYGSPVAQPRQRHTPLMKDGKPLIGRGGRPVVVNYTPKTALANQWKTDIKAAAFAELCAAGQVSDLSLWDGPIAAHITVFFPRPKRLMRAKDPDGPVLHIAKPDRDNVEKTILDALKGIVFIDDCQVCSGAVRKFYHEKTGRPRAEITMEKIEQ